MFLLVLAALQAQFIHAVVKVALHVLHVAGQIDEFLLDFFRVVDLHIVRGFLPGFHRPLCGRQGVPHFGDDLTQLDFFSPVLLSF